MYFKPIIREFPNRVTQPASFLRVLIKINIFQQNESFDFLRANSRIVTQTAGSPFNKPVFTKMFLQKSRPFTARKNQNTKTQKKKHRRSLFFCTATTITRILCPNVEFCEEPSKKSKRPIILKVLKF